MGVGGGGRVWNMTLHGRARGPAGGVGVRVELKALGSDEGAGPGHVGME